MSTKEVIKCQYEALIELSGNCPGKAEKYCFWENEKIPKKFRSIIREYEKKGNMPSKDDLIYQTSEYLHRDIRKMF